MQPTAESKNSKVILGDDQGHRPDSGRTWYWLCAAVISSVVATCVYCSGSVTLMNYSDVNEQLFKEVRHGNFRNLSIKEESESVCTASSHFHEIRTLDSAQTSTLKNIGGQGDEEVPIAEGTCTAADKLD